MGLRSWRLINMVWPRWQGFLWPLWCVHQIWPSQFLEMYNIIWPTKSEKGYQKWTQACITYICNYKNWTLLWRWGLIHFLLPFPLWNYNLLFAPIFSNLVKIQQVKSAICNQTYHSQARFVVSLRFARTNMQLVTLCDGFWKLCFLMGSTIIYQIFMSALLCNVTMSKLFTNVIKYITVQNKTVLDCFPFFGQMILVNLLIIEGCCWLKMYILVALFWGLIIDLVSFWCYYFQSLFPWFSITVIFICHFLITFVNLTFFIIIHVCFRIIGFFHLAIILALPFFQLPL